jgi:cytochrome c peroxidase
MTHFKIVDLIKLFFFGVLLTALSCVVLSNSTSENPISTKAQLGEKLFKDPILSRDYSVSCASCHKPEHGFADDTPTSKGVGGKFGTRNTPSAMNMAFRVSFFWDGRASTLAEQALMPIEDPNEMDLKIVEAIERLNASKIYRSLFKKIYGSAPNRENLGDAIASFERTLETEGTAFDRFMRGEENAISESAKRGQELFNVKAKCFDCHFGPDFTVDEFKNIGLYNGKELNDVGRFAITKDSADLGKFKVSGLRNIVKTAPYMHNGQFNTLMEVIDYYDNPAKFVKGSINIDTTLQKPLGLTFEEKKDIEAFLMTLTDK